MMRDGARVSEHLAVQMVDEAPRPTPKPAPAPAPPKDDPKPADDDDETRNPDGQ